MGPSFFEIHSVRKLWSYLLHYMRTGVRGFISNRSNRSIRGLYIQARPDILRHLLPFRVCYVEIMNVSDKTIGVLALQGDYALHERQIVALGAQYREVRLPRDMEGLDALIMPGGESTTMDILIDRFGLRQPIAAFGAARPVYGTCAGMILLAKDIERNQAGVKTFGLIDIDVARNDYGRQVFSFEEEIEADFHGTKKRFLGGFIRAPRVTRVGAAVTVLARFQDWPVLVEQNNILAASFHSELEADTTLLEYFFVHFLLDRADHKRILGG